MRQGMQTQLFVYVRNGCAKRAPASQLASRQAGVCVCVCVCVRVCVCGGECAQGLPRVSLNRGLPDFPFTPFTYQAGE